MSNEYYGSSFVPFIGVVEHVIDDTHARVRCFGIHPIDRTKVRTDQLPAALISYPTTGGQVGGGNISHNLSIDSWVMGFFTDYPVCMNMIITSVFPSGAYSMSSAAFGGGEFVGQSSTNSFNIDPVVGDRTVEVPSYNLEGSNNIHKTYNYIYDKLIAERSSNDPHLHTSAALGVLMLETSGINPTTVNSIGAYGICQWLEPRRSQLFDRYGRTTRLDQQLDFMWWELNNTEKRPKSRWLSARSMDDAVEGFATFERAEEWQNGKINRLHRNYKIRLQYAYQIYNEIKR